MWIFITEVFGLYLFIHRLWWSTCFQWRTSCLRKFPERFAPSQLRKLRLFTSLRTICTSEIQSIWRLTYCMWSLILALARETPGMLMHFLAMTIFYSFIYIIYIYIYIYIYHFIIKRKKKILVISCIFYICCKFLQVIRCRQAVLYRHHKLHEKRCNGSSAQVLYSGLKCAHKEIP